MEIVGKNIYVQRGEDLTFDVDLRNKRGEPYMIPQTFRNPYLVITVASARYEQPGDFRISQWLDLSSCYIEKASGVLTLQNIPRFADTVAYPLSVFSVQDAYSIYGEDRGGPMTLSPTASNGITKFLFYTIGDADYMYPEYSMLSGNVTGETWHKYRLRLMTSLPTHNFVEQSYLCDAKIVSGDTIMERITDLLKSQGLDISTNVWSDDEYREYIALIVDDKEREKVQNSYEQGMPLVSDYDTKNVIWEKMNIYVSANLQGG